MHSTLRSLVLAASLLLPITASADIETEEHKKTITTGDFRANYALRDVPSVDRMHGFGLGIKLYTVERGSIEVEGRVADIDLAYSGELAFDATFGKRNLYALGVLGGSGLYTHRAEGALEITVGLLRAAFLTSPTQLVWNPNIGLELKLGPLTATPSLQGYVGNSVKGVGFGLNAGLSL